MISYLNKSGLKIKERLFQYIARTEGEVDEIRSVLNSGINFKEYEEDLFYELNEFNSLQQCNSEDFESFKRYLEYKTKKIHLLKEIIGEDYVSYKEYILGEKNKLEGKLNEVKSKIAFLGGFQGSVVSSLVEDFNNYNQIDSREENTLPIDTRAHVLTLPVQNENTVSVKDIKILSSSNGIPGNILEETNSYLSNTINNAENLYFEYYKKGSQSLKLNLEITLNKEEIVNSISFKIKQKYLESNFIINNINFISSDEESVSLYNLIDSSEQELFIESYNADNEIAIKLLPVKAFKIKIYLECSEDTIINDLSYNVIALKEIVIKKLRYADSGKINFKEFELENSDGKTLFSKVKSYPKKEELLNYKHIVSFENESELIFKNENIILEENYNSVKYKFQLDKPENLNSLYSDNVEDLEINLNIKQEVFNRDVIPNTFIIDSNTEYLDVYQPDIYNRSFLLRKGRRVGRTTEDITKLLLPENLNSLNIDIENLQVYLNNEICNWKNTSALTNNLDYFCDEEHLWVFDSSEAKNKIVRIAFTPKECRSVLKEEKVFFKIDEFFDRDLENINVLSFSNELLFSSEIISIDSNYQGYINLNKSYVKNVKVETLSTSQALNTWVDSTDKFEIDKKLGTLKQKVVLLELVSIRIEYEYFKYKQEKPEKIWIKNNKIYGCSIPINKIYNNQYTQIKGELWMPGKWLRDITLPRGDESDVVLKSNQIALKSRNILEGSLFVSLDFFDIERKPKEVPFINGEDEFLKLELIDKESVPLMESNSLGEIKFTLRRKPNNSNNIRVYKDNILVEDIEFSIEERVLTLNIPESSSKGYSVSYFTENKTENDDSYIEYSVDYLNGFLYCEKEVSRNTDEEQYIKFSSTNSVLEFGICKEINAYEKEGRQISINFSNSSKVNEKVKLSWKKKIEKDNSELMDYYSPIIYQIHYGIRG